MNYSTDEGPTILVADDEPYIRELVQIALTTAGFRVLMAANGRVAVELLAQHRGGVDAALLDVNMPEMGGTEALCRLHAMDPNLPCCLMAGDCSAEGIAELVESGAADLLAKPFKFSNLVAEIGDLVARGVAV